MRSLSGTFLTMTGLLACPCHLFWTLPLLGLVGGTSLTLFVRDHTGLIFAVASVYFLIAVGAGLSLLARSINPTDRSSCCSVTRTLAADDDQPLLVRDRSARMPARR
jgi:hypothetical protein